MHQRIERFGFYYGFPVFFMTTKDRATGADDLTPLSSSWTLGNTMVIGIGQGNKGFQNLEEGGEATFSVPDGTLYEQLKRIEKTTGVREPAGVKKELGYTYCSRINSPPPASHSCPARRCGQCGLRSVPSISRPSWRASRPRIGSPSSSAGSWRSSSRMNCCGTDGSTRQSGTRSSTNSKNIRRRAIESV